MKIKIFLPLFFLMHFSVAQVLTNGGFENWATVPTGHLDPVGWSSTNMAGYPPNSVQGPGRTGNYSLHLIATPADAFSYQQCYLMHNYYGNLKPLTLSGYWKGNLSTATNVLQVYTFVYSAGAIIGGAGVILQTLAPAWTFFTVPFNYTSTNTPDSTFTSVYLQVVDSAADAYVDDLSITFTTGIGEIISMQLLGTSLLQEGNGNYSLSLNLSSPQTFSLQVFSIDGKKISEKIYSLQSGSQQIPLSTDHLEAGVYFLKVRGEKEERVAKFVKQ